MRIKVDLDLWHDQVRRDGARPEYTDAMKPFVELMAHNRAAIRLDADRVRSWDHRKLGLPAMELGGSTAAYRE